MDRKVIEHSAASGRVLRKYCMGALFLSAFPLFANATELVVPAYFDPTAKSALWTQLVSTAAANPTTVIMNPDNGPGNAQNPAYISAIAKVRAAGGKVIGYVSTRSTKRALSTVVADINKYVAFYKIDGIFVDEMTSDSVISHIQYYQSVYNYVKGLSANYTVMGNPGTNTQELYVSLPTVDKIVVFEDTAKHYAKFRAFCVASELSEEPLRKYGLYERGRSVADCDELRRGAWCRRRIRDVRSYAESI